MSRTPEVDAAIREVYLPVCADRAHYAHILAASPGLSNEEWPKLKEARKAEEDAARSVCAVNSVQQEADRLREAGEK